jgi:hypothetical protein
MKTSLSPNILESNAILSLSKPIRPDDLKIRTYALLNTTTTGPNEMLREMENAAQNGFTYKMLGS